VVSTPRHTWRHLDRVRRPTSPASPSGAGGGHDRPPHPDFRTELAAVPHMAATDLVVDTRSGPHSPSPLQRPHGLDGWGSPFDVVAGRRPRRRHPDHAGVVGTRPRGTEHRLVGGAAARLPDGVEEGLAHGACSPDPTTSRRWSPRSAAPQTLRFRQGRFRTTRARMTVLRAGEWGLACWHASPCGRRGDPPRRLRRDPAGGVLTCTTDLGGARSRCTATHMSHLHPLVTRQYRLLGKSCLPQTGRGSGRRHEPWGPPVNSFFHRRGAGPSPGAPGPLTGPQPARPRADHRALSVDRPGRHPSDPTIGRWWCGSHFPRRAGTTSPRRGSVGP